MQVFRRPGKISGFCDGDKGREMVKFHMIDRSDFPKASFQNH
jgi:hypothetical protein